MSRSSLRFVFFGLAISSAWGNGHATTYRGLVRELARRGHRVVFYERRTAWFDDNCDLPQADYCDIRRYESWPPAGVEGDVASADVVVLGSFVGAGQGDGVTIAGWLPERTKALLVYFDIDTPRTLQDFREQGQTDYLLPAQVPLFDLVLSFAGGPALEELRALGARHVEPFYCAVDATVYAPVAPDPRYAGDLGYMGTYDDSRQPALDELFVAPARARSQQDFVLAGAEYPATISDAWPANVRRFVHVNPDDHPAFYSSCAWQVKVTRAPMRRAGWSPSVTLFEAAACGAALISDRWPGFETFFAPGREALVADRREDVLEALALPEEARRSLGAAGRARILRQHTYAHRVDQLEVALAALGVSSPSSSPERPDSPGSSEGVAGGQDGR